MGVTLASPKSRILVCPRLVRKILAGFMSRCVLGFLAELLLMLWLLVKGVNVQRWKEQAGKAS